jgi:hypothetical protein
MNLFLCNQPHRSPLNFGLSSAAQPTELKTQAIRAVMRKILHVIYGMLRSKQSFDGRMFFVWKPHDFSKIICKKREYLLR